MSGEGCRKVSSHGCVHFAVAGVCKFLSSLSLLSVDCPLDRRGDLRDACRVGLLERRELWVLGVQGGSLVSGSFGELFLTAGEPLFSLDLVDRLRRRESRMAGEVLMVAALTTD